MKLLRQCASFVWFVLVTVGVLIFLAVYMAWWLLTDHEDEWKAAHS